MAPLPVISGVFRVALTWSQTEVPSNAVNVMHFSSPGSNPAELVAQFVAHATNNMWNCQGTHASISHIDVTPLDGSSVTYPYDTGSPTNLSGLRTTNSPQLQVANIVKMLTAKRGRSYRGRVFLPWVDEAASEDGKLPGAAPIVTAAWVAFRTAMAGDDFHMCVASYKLATQEPVVAVACEAWVATQRRRVHRTSTTA